MRTSKYLNMDIDNLRLEIDVENIDEINNKLLLIDDLDVFKKQKLFAYIVASSESPKISKIDEHIKELDNYIFYPTPLDINRFKNVWHDCIFTEYGILKRL